MDEFAVEGLRTLVLSSRKIETAEFKAWKARYDDARNQVVDKKEKMEALQEELEKNLNIVGATAIEDKLQDQVRKHI